MSYAFGLPLSLYLAIKATDPATISMLEHRYSTGLSGGTMVAAATSWNVRKVMPTPRNRNMTPTSRIRTLTLESGALIEVIFASSATADGE